MFFPYVTGLKLRCGNLSVHTFSARIKQRKSFVRKAVIYKGASLGPFMVLKGRPGAELYRFPFHRQWQSGSRSSQ